jgi:hypothetical protein
MADDIANSGSANHGLPTRICGALNDAASCSSRTSCATRASPASAWGRALDEAEDLAALFADSDRARGSCEPDPREVFEQRVNSRRPVPPVRRHRSLSVET